MNDIEKMNVTELESLILDPRFKWLEAHERREVLAWRRRLLNKSFEWSEENIKKIEKINDRLLQTMNEAYDQVAEVQSDLNKLATSGSNLYRGCVISGEIVIDVYCDITDSLAQKILEKVSFYSSSLWSVNVCGNQNMQDRDECLLTCHNWDIETFEPVKIKGLQICYATHVMFEDDHVFSLEDMIKLKEENISTHIEIHI